MFIQWYLCPLQANSIPDPFLPKEPKLNLGIASVYVALPGGNYCVLRLNGDAVAHTTMTNTTGVRRINLSQPVSAAIQTFISTSWPNLVDADPLKLIDKLIQSSNPVLSRSGCAQPSDGTAVEQ